MFQNSIETLEWEIQMKILEIHAQKVLLKSLFWFFMMIGIDPLFAKDSICHILHF